MRRFAAKSVLRSVTRVALIVALEWTLVRLGLVVSLLHPSVSPLWPASGFAIVATLVVGLPAVPAVFLGAAFANWSAGVTWPVGLTSGAANAIEAWIAFALLRAVPGRDHVFDRLREGSTHFAGAAAIATAVAATLGVGGLVVAGATTPDNAGVLWTEWWLGDLLGALVIAPLIAAWSNPDWRGKLLGGIELPTAASVPIAVVGWWLFGTAGLPREGLAAALAYLSLPAAGWAAFRLGTRGATAVTLTIALGSAAATLRGVGPFALNSPTETHLHLQAFLVVVATSVLALNAVLAERRRAAVALEASERRLRVLTASAPDLILQIDREGRLEFANRPIAGRPPEEWHGRRLDELVVDADRGRAASAVAAVVGEARPAELDLHLADTGGRDWRAYASRLAPIVVDGRVDAVTLVARDVTEIRAAAAAGERIQAQFREARKMEALGQMAGGVAQEFNNLLAILLGNAEMLDQWLGRRPEVDSDGAARKAVAEMRTAGRRALALTRQLRAFGLKRRAGDTKVDVNAIVDGLGATLDGVLGSTVRLEIDLAAELPPIRCDEGELQEALVNLALNARDAMQRGGRLRIETSVVDLAAAPGATSTSARTGRHVMIAVSDDGVGMGEETKARIFEPFFTTKPTSRSIGLGLSTVYGIVLAAGGHIRVESAPGRGSCFRLLLPALDAAPTGERPAAPATGSELVLVCEDEPLVRQLSTRVLRAGGYRVIEAENGERALAAAREHPGPIHLLLTDLDLPGIGGRELARRLRAERRETRVLYVSGLLAATHDGEPDHPSPDLLEKPFSATTLLHRVRDVLDESEVLV